MKKAYHCPKCGKTVGIADINVAADIVLCKSCGETSRFSDLVNEEREIEASRDEATLLAAQPPKHLKVVADPMAMDGKVTFIFRRFSKSVLFLIPFTAVWSGFSMVIIYGSQIAKHSFDLGASLFGLPFLLGTILLVSVCLFGVFGKRVLTLQRGKGRYWFGVGVIGFWKNFVYTRRTKVSLGWTTYSTNNQNLPELHLTTDGSSDKTHICAGMSEDALEYIAAYLKREIARS